MMNCHPFYPVTEGIHSSSETEIVMFVIFLVVFAAIFIPLLLILTGEGKAAKNRAYARRIAEAKMNARLLRLNI